MPRAIASFLLLSAGLLALPAGAAAGACRAESGAGRVALAELFTSEGCSSCPPADRWLSGLPARGLGPDRVVPLAFHVDYWDYIGWKDRYARPEHTQRQKQASARSGARFVYTPQLLLNGRDFPRWGGAAFAEELARANRASPGAQVGLALGAAPGAIEVGATASLTVSARAGVALFVALYENRLATEVKAGENRGATLRHDFVVRELVGPLGFGPDGRAQLQRTLRLPPGARPEHLGAAAFVQDENSGEVLQALVLPYCG